MSNQQSSGKGSTSTVGSQPPAWATPGTEQYGNMNTTLQTAPMGVANQTLAQGGLGDTSKAVSGNLAGSDGTNDWMRQAANTLSNPGQAGQQNYQSVFNAAGQPGAAQQYLSGTANGDFLNGSPQLNDIITRSNQQIGDQTNQLFSGAGRYGSGVHQGTLASAIGANTSNLLNQNYQAERDRQMQAGSAIGAEQQNRLGLQGTAAGGMVGAEGQRLNAAQGLGALGQSAQSNQFRDQIGAAGLENQGFQNMLGMIQQLPTIQGNKVFDANQQMQVGGQIDQAAQAQLDALINQWQKGDMEDWSRLGGLISGATGAAGNYGTQSGTSQTKTPVNPLQALGLLGSLFL